MGGYPRTAAFGIISTLSAFVYSQSVSLVVDSQPIISSTAVAAATTPIVQPLTTSPIAATTTPVIPGTTVASPVVASPAATSIIPTCIEPRSETDPAGADISGALTSVDAVNQACGGDGQQTSTDGYLSIIYYSTGSMFLNVSHSTLVSAPIEVSPEFCPDHFNAIINSCIVNGNFWGGWWSTTNANYSVTNFIYPANGLPGAQPVSTAAPLTNTPLPGTTSLPGTPLPGTTSLPETPLPGTTSLPGTPLPGTTSLPGTPLPGTTSLPGTPLPGTTSAPLETPFPGTTSVPGVTPIPGTTSVPVETPLPGTTSVPGETPLPGTTSIPGQTPLPGTTSVPGQTPLPGTTSIPGQTPLPGTTSVPGQTPLPGTTSLPGQTPLPGTTSVPGQTPLPGTSSLPGQTPLPGTSSVPGETPLPGTTSVPGATPLPGTSSVPEETPLPGTSGVGTTKVLPSGDEIVYATISSHVYSETFAPFTDPAFATLATTISTFSVNPQGVTISYEIGPGGIEWQPITPSTGTPGPDLPRPTDLPAHSDIPSQTPSGTPSATATNQVTSTAAPGTTTNVGATTTAGQPTITPAPSTTQAGGTEALHTITAYNSDVSSVASIIGVTANTHISTGDSSHPSAIIPVLWGCWFCPPGAGLLLWGMTFPGIYPPPVPPPFPSFPPITIGHDGKQARANMRAERRAKKAKLRTVKRAIREASMPRVNNTSCLISNSTPTEAPTEAPIQDDADAESTVITALENIVAVKNPASHLVLPRLSTIGVSIRINLNTIQATFV